MNNTNKKTGTLKMTWFVMALALFFVSVFSSNLQFPFLILEEHKEEYTSIANNGEKENSPFSEESVPLDFEETDTSDSSNEEEITKDKVVKINAAKNVLGLSKPQAHLLKRIENSKPYYSNIVLDIICPPPRS